MRTKQFLTWFVVLVFASSIAAQTQTSNTPIDLGSAALAANANLPQNNFPGSSLADALVRAQSLAATKGITSPGLVFTAFDEPSTGATPDNVSRLYQRLACTAVTIIIGHPNDSQFHISSSQTTVYGDYDFSVDAVLKNGLKAPQVIGNRIVVTRPGGTITLGTGTMNQVMYVHEGFPDWQTGKAYLLFLGYFPPTGAFFPVDAFSTFVGNSTTGWTVARKAYAQNPVFSFSRGVFEQSITQWVGSCSN